jgi:hypothetical protein
MQPNRTEDTKGDADGVPNKITISTSSIKKVSNKDPYFPIINSP